MNYFIFMLEGECLTLRVLGLRFDVRIGAYVVVYIVRSRNLIRHRTLIPTYCVTTTSPLSRYLKSFTLVAPRDVLYY